MIRCFALILAFVLPFSANACQDQVRYLKGVKINTTQSATRLCGCDFVISVSDGDQHLVKIDYSYNGMFKTSAGAPETPMNLVQGTRSDKINISVGRNTLAGNLARVAAPEFPIDTLVCRGWFFSFTASEYNASQDARSHEDKLKQKEQARIDEINRKKVEEAEKKRKALQNQIEYKKARDQASRDQLAAYKNSSPENSRCIINEPADIARCEQAKARERADRLKLEANEKQKQKQLEAKQIAAAKQEAQFKDAEALYQLTRSDPCAAAAENSRRMPQAQLQGQQNKAAAMQQEQALAQWKQAQSGHDAACAASKNQQQVGTTNPSPEEAGVALLRRGSNSGSDLFQSAINKAEQEERERPIREARERVAAEDRARVRQQPVSVASLGKTAGAHTSSRYSSVCKRNNEKIDQILVASGVRQFGASNDLFLRDVNLMGAKLYQPCVGSDSSAADTYRSTMAEAARINRYCAGSHRSFECTQWGSNADANRNWYVVFEAEVNKALSDPGYSANLDGGAAQSVTSKASGACKSAYDRQEAEFGLISQRIANTQSVVSQLQLLMDMLNKRMALLDQFCKGQPQYSQYADTKLQFESAMRNCRGIASSPSDCGAQQPQTNLPVLDSPQRCYVDGNRKCIGAPGCIQPPGGCIQTR